MLASCVSVRALSTSPCSLTNIAEVARAAVRFPVGLDTQATARGAELAAELAAVERQRAKEVREARATQEELQELLGRAEAWQRRAEAAEAELRDPSKPTDATDAFRHVEPPLTVHATESPSPPHGLHGASPTSVSPPVQYSGVQCSASIALSASRTEPHSATASRHGACNRELSAHRSTHRSARADAPGFDADDPFTPGPQPVWCSAGGALTTQASIAPATVAPAAAVGTDGCVCVAGLEMTSSEGTAACITPRAAADVAWGSSWGGSPGGSCSFSGGPSSPVK